MFIYQNVSVLCKPTTFSVNLHILSLQVNAHRYAWLYHNSCKHSLTGDNICCQHILVLTMLLQAFL